MENQGYEATDPVEGTETGVQPDRAPVHWDPFPQPRGWVMMCDDDECGCCGHTEGHLPHFGPGGQPA